MISTLKRKKLQDANLPLTYYVIQTAFLLFSSIGSSFSIYLAWYFTKNGIPADKLGLFLAVASVSGLLQFIALSFISLTNKERVVSVFFSLVLLACLSVILVSNIPIWFLAVAAFIFSAMVSFVKTASVSTIPRTSPLSGSERAFSTHTALFSFEPLIGPMACSFLLAAIGGNGYIIFAMAMIFIGGGIFISFNIEKAQIEDKQSNFNGLSLLWRVRTELGIAIISAVFNFAFYPFLVLILPILILSSLKLSAFYVGISQCLFALGIFLGSYYGVTYVKKLFSAQISIMLGGILMALAIVTCAKFPNIYVIGIVQIINGVGLALFNVNATQIRCLATPEAYRSRLEAAFMMLCMISIPAGLWFFGFSIEKGSIAVATLICGALLLFASLAVLIVPNLGKLSCLSGNALNGCYADIYPRAFRISDSSNEV